MSESEEKTFQITIDTNPSGLVHSTGAPAESLYEDIINEVRFDPLFKYHTMLSRKAGNAVFETNTKGVNKFNLLYSHLMDPSCYLIIEEYKQ